MFVPVPTATHNVPFHAIPFPVPEDPNKESSDLIPSQSIPFDEYAIVFVPSPTATHNVPFHATP